MEKIVLGRTGIKVSRLAFGGLFVASFVNQLEQAKAAVRKALDLGINYFDTAPGYGNSEEVLGLALDGETRPLVISTKLGGRPLPFKPQDKGCLRASVQESLKLLKRDHIDILMVHEPDRPGQYDWWTDFVEVHGPVLELMDELKKEGLIRFTGLGGTTVHELAHLVGSGKFDVVLTAFNYSLLWREAENVILPVAREKKIGVVAGSPLQQGALARKYEETVNNSKVYWLSQARKDQFKALYKLVDQSGIPLPEMALRFVLSNPRVDSVLMGARSPEEVIQNVASAEKGALPAEILKRLDEIAARVPYRPFEEPFGLGWILNAPFGYKGPGGA